MRPGNDQSHSGNDNLVDPSASSRASPEVVGVAGLPARAARAYDAPPPAGPATASRISLATVANEQASRRPMAIKISSQEAGVTRPPVLWWDSGSSSKFSTSSVQTFTTA